MSDTSPFGFGKFIPGFEFLQNLAQNAGSANNPMGRMSQWVAPTVSVEEVEKRIAELKTVQFWLEQNGKALAATIQALEVQRMTLSTLQGMNVSMGDLAKSFPFTGVASATAAATEAAQKGFGAWPMPGDSAPQQAAAPEPAPQAAAEPEPQPEPQAEAQESDAAANPQQQAQAAVGQAMQWWGALTQQFQQIAAKAMAEPVPAETVAAAQRASDMASQFAKASMDKVMQQAEAFTADKTKPQATEDKPGAARAAPAKKAAAKAAGKPAAKEAAKPAAKKAAAKKSSTRG